MYQREGNVEYGYMIECSIGYLQSLIITEYADSRVSSYCNFDFVSHEFTKDIEKILEEFQHPEKQDYCIEKTDYFYDGNRVTRLIFEQGLYINSTNSYREYSRLDHTVDPKRSGN